MKKSFPILLLSLPMIMFACSKNPGNTQNLYVPTSADVTSNATLSELQQGRVLYVNNCAECHGLHSPDEYTSSQWSSIMSSMGPRTNMSPAQIELVRKYVTRGK